MKTSNRKRWWRHSINHNSGTRTWNYIFDTEGQAEWLAEEHFEHNMPDSAKWRGYQFEPAKNVPRKVLRARRSALLMSALHDAAPDMERALSDMLDMWKRHCAPRSIEGDSQVMDARAVLARASTIDRTRPFST